MSFPEGSAVVQVTGQSCRTLEALIEQVIALNKLRGGGQQNVTVKHIHIHEGGQAIVGNVNSQGGGAEKKIKEQTHAITNAQEPKMPGMDTQGDKVPVTGNE